MRIQFGQTKTSKVKLINGSSLHHFTIETSLASHKTVLRGYDYTAVENIQNAAERTQSGSRDRFAVSMGWNQGSVARNDIKMGSYTNNAQNREEIDEMVRLKTAGDDANSVFYSGTSYYPIGLGQVFTIQNKNVTHELLAVEVTHLSDTNGNYSCTFRAIPADVAAPHYTNVKAFAMAESQPAKIIGNNDPEGLGRVKVQFYWNTWDTESEWMRMIQLHSGAGKGFYFIPEIGEEVLVGFEGGNVECPFVMGTQYNGQASSGYNTPNNDIKAIHTRSGHIIKFTEDESIIIADKSGNEIHLDTEGSNINITAPETMTLNCKNMNINVSENMTSNIGQNKTDIIGVNYAESVGGFKELGVGGDFNAVIEGKYAEHIKGNLESVTDNDRHENGKTGFSHNSEGNIDKNAQKKIHNNSGEQTRQN